MNSLERSLQLWLTTSLLILMFVFWWSVSLTSRMMTDSHVFAQLEEQAYNIHDLVDSDQSRSRSHIDQFAQSHPQRIYVIERNGGIFQTSTVMDTDNLDISSLVPALQPGQSLRLSHTANRNQPLLGWYGGFSSGDEDAVDGAYVMGLLQDVSSIRDKLAVFQWFAALFAVLLLAVLLAVQHFILRRSVEKLDGIRRDLLRLDHGQAVALSEDVPSEIMPLVTEFNLLLRRFEQRLRQSRNAVGNLAHSLKGPLNLLIRSSEAEVIGDAEKSAIAQNAEHIRKLIESELKRARLAGRGAVGIRFDFDAEIPAMIGLLEQVYPEKAAAVNFTIAKDVDLIYDRQDMLELIGNLLDNAVKWCNSRVELSLRSADGVIIDVEDDGPGCSAEVLGSLTQRGVRLDENVAGHGLGLSIVKDIVDTYDGRLQLETSSALGGLKVSVYLPKRR